MFNDHVIEMRTRCFNPLIAKAHVRYVFFRRVSKKYLKTVDVLHARAETLPSNHRFCLNLILFSISTHLHKNLGMGGSKTLFQH